MKIAVTILVAFIISEATHPASAQSAGRQLKLTSINQLALTFGNDIDKQMGVGLFSTNGVVYGKWFTGLGFGYQNYAFDSFPIYVQIERKFSTEKERDALYINGGVNLFVDKDQVPSVLPVTSVSRCQQKLGFWGEFGYGNRFYFLKTIPVQFHIAYNRQTVPTIETIQPQVQGLPVIKNTYTYTYQIILIKFGIYFERLFRNQ